VLVIFDCDGVLIDSEVIFCAVDADALTQLGYPTQASDLLERFVGVSHHEAWGQLAAELGLDLPDNWVESILRECDRRFATELVAVPGTVATLQAIGESGHAVCVASSTELGRLRTNLANAGILSQVEPWVFSASQVKRPKPAPDVFMFAAAQMGFDPSEILVIEDSVAGVTAARRAGMQVLGFTGGSHAYDSLGPRLVAAGAQATFASMAHLLEGILHHLRNHSLAATTTQVRVQAGV